MADKTSAEPMYIMIYRDIRDKILADMLTPGELLPSENELATLHNVSRVTVRQSFKQLEKEGFVFSRPKRGYFVNKPRMNEFTVPYYKDLDSFQTVYKDVTVIQPDEELQEALQISADRKVVVIPRIRFDDGLPFSYEVLYTPYRKGYPVIESSIKYAVFPELVAEKTSSFGYHIEMEMQVTSAGGEVKKALGCADGEPLMLITQKIISQSGDRSYSKNYMRSPYDKLTGVSGYQYS